MAGFGLLGSHVVRIMPFVVAIVVHVHHYPAADGILLHLTYALLNLDLLLASMDGQQTVQ